MMTAFKSIFHILKKSMRRIIGLTIKQKISSVKKSLSHMAIT